jgi:hypothetical protein
MPQTPYILPTKPAYRSRIFRDFKGINPEAYHSIIRFYEEKEEAIRRLEWEEYFELVVAYTHALFRTGAYRRFLLMADVVVAESIENNHSILNGEDIFLRTLYQKAYAHVRLLELSQARHVLDELLRINPFYEGAAKLYRTSWYREQPAYMQWTRAASILMFLLAALVIGIEVMLIRPFYNAHTFAFEMTRIGIFLLGTFFLIIGNLVHFLRCDMRTKRRIEQLKKHYEKKKHASRIE